METVLASLGLSVCVLLLLRMALPPRARERLDRVGRALRGRCVALYARLIGRARRRAPGPVRPDPKAARQLAEEAIQRARGGSGAPDGEWHGNVFRPRGVDWSGPPAGRPGDEPRD